VSRSRSAFLYRGEVGVLKIDPTGLDALAAQHQEWAASIAMPTAPPVAGPSSQASATAVEAVKVSVDAAAGVLAERLVATAEKLSSAANVYRSQDARSAADVTATGDTIAV
jgi:hypothetical protein